MSEREFRPPQEASVTVTPIRRRPRTRQRVYRGPGAFTRLLLGLLVLAAGIAGVGYVYYARVILPRAAYAITLNGQTLAVLRSRDVAHRVLLDVRKAAAPHAPRVVRFEEGEPQLVPHGGRATSLTPDAAVDNLRKQLTPVYDGFAIFVNSRPLALLESREAAWEAISLMLDRGMGAQQGIPTIKERVRIDHLHVTPDKAEGILLAAPAQVARELVRPPRPRVHIVERGDNFWKIATEHQMTVDDLKALNPGVNHKALHAGDRIKLPDEPSPVTVVVRKVVTPGRQRTPAAPPRHAAGSATNAAPAGGTVTPPAPPSTSPNTRDGNTEQRDGADTRQPSTRPTTTDRTPARAPRPPAQTGATNTTHRAPATTERARTPETITPPATPRPAPVTADQPRAPETDTTEPAATTTPAPEYHKPIAERKAGSGRTDTPDAAQPH